MATIKSYTDINQSRKLAEILPLESADMYYPWDIDSKSFLNIPIFKDDNYYVQGSIPCWSFTSLFNILPDDTDVIKGKSDTENEKYVCTVGVTNGIISTFGNNPVDTCVDMIKNLYELNLLL